MGSNGCPCPAARCTHAMGRSGKDKGKPGAKIPSFQSSGARAFGGKPIKPKKR